MPVPKANQSSYINTSDIINYYNDGHSVKECSIHFNLGQEAIRVRFRKAGVSDCRKSRNHINNIKEIIDYYMSGHSIKDCINKFILRYSRED